MKTILVPTDFSMNAEVALNYAMMLAKQQHAKIILMHAFEVNYASGEVPFDVIAEEIAEAKKDSEKQLLILCDKIKGAGAIKYEYLYLEDSPVEAVLTTIKERNVDFVVMGTHGVTGIGSTIFGSNTAKVIEKASCPVLAVPDTAEFTPVKKITFATDFHKSDLVVLKEIIKIAEPMNMQLNILHVSATLQFPSDEKERMIKFKDEVNREIVYSNLSFQLLTDENIMEGLQEYLNSESTGILAMNTHHRNLFDKLFGSSLTKRMAFHSTVPLLTFHSARKKSEIVF